MSSLARAASAIASIALWVAVIAGCAADETASVDLDLVAAERSERLIGIWFDSTQAAQREVREQWPQSPPIDFVFTRWVEPHRYREQLQACVAEALGRPVELGAEALPGEPPWRPAIAEVRCRHEFPPFSAEFSLGGPIEARWLETQLSSALPMCARAFGGRIEIADAAAVIEAIRDRPRSAEGPRDIWSIVPVSGLSPLDRVALRASCPDPALALDRLPLPVIDR